MISKRLEAERPLPCVVKMSPRKEFALADERSCRSIISPFLNRKMVYLFSMLWLGGGVVVGRDASG